MSIITKEIKIFFYSNFNNEKIEFELSKLYNETKEDGKIVKLNTTGLNKLPYFTLSVKYPKDKLLNNLKTYQERVEFFFNKKKFENILFLSVDKSEFSVNDEPSVIGEHNVMVMIELLFPTKFTVINNFHTSYDHVFDKSSLERMIINPLTQKNYSYLKLSDGKIYTFIRLVWLNDLLNHPKYKELLDSFIIFWNWYKREINKISKNENENIINQTAKLIVDVLDDINKKINEIKPIPKIKINDNVGYTIEYLKNLKTFLDKKNLTEIENLERKKFLRYSNSPIIKIDIKTKTNLEEINKNINIIITENKNKPSKMKEYEDLIKTSDKIKNSSKSPFGEYRNFISFKNKYTIGNFNYPKYISTNEKLKDFFNTDALDENVKTFFNIFEKIYNIFIAGTSDKLTPDEETTLKDIMNTSVNIVYPDNNSYVSSYSNASYYEIYIMADFIQGKVDDSNSNKIFCPYVGDYLGNMFELLFQLQLYGKSDKQDIYRWDITRNRVTFSIENLELKTGEMKDQSDKPMGKNNRTNENYNQKFNQNVNQNANNRPNTKKKINDTKFLYDVNTNNKELNKIIEKLKNYQIYINESSLSSDIKKYNEKLYDIIADTYVDEANYDKKLAEKIKKLNYELKAENEIKNKGIEDTEKQNNFDPNKVIKMEKDVLLNELYIEILNKLYEIEDKKNKNISVGGTKKRRVFRKKYQTYKKYRL
jgi:hypothetical protein